MESKNLKPRILDALDVIGKPATAREIASVGAIDENIHARLKEMTERGDLFRLQEAGQPIKYALPTMAHEESQPMKRDEMIQPQVAEQATDAPMPEKTRFLDIYESIQEQNIAMAAAMTRYADRVLSEDPVYRAMSETILRLQQTLDELSIKGLV